MYIRMIVLPTYTAILAGLLVLRDGYQALIGIITNGSQLSGSLRAGLREMVRQFTVGAKLGGFGSGLTRCR